MRKHIPDEVLAFMADKFRMLSEPSRLSILRTLVVKRESGRRLRAVAPLRTPPGCRSFAR